MEPEQKSNGALIGSIIVVVILIIGGIYLWQNNMKEKVDGEDVGAKVDTSDVTNSANAIDAELNNVDLEGLDTGI